MSNNPKFSELSDKDTKRMTFLVTSIEGKIDRKGNDYCEVECCDGEQNIVCRLWNKRTEEAGFTAGDVITASVSVMEYRGGLSYSFQSCRKENSDRAAEFIRTPPMPISEMWQWIERRSSSMREPFYLIVKKLVLDNKEAYCHASAARSNHHDYVGGLLYHSYRIARAADVLSPLYDMDSDLAVAGALLHDIGKLVEMDTDSLGHVEYTIAGQLQGHLLIGCKMINDAADKIGREKFPADEIECLEHIIASHHGKQEMGAIREPAFKEAMFVSALDMLDMKLSVYDEEAKATTIGKFSNNMNNIVGRIYVPATGAMERLS